MRQNMNTGINSTRFQENSCQIIVKIIVEIFFKIVVCGSQLFHKSCPISWSKYHNNAITVAAIVFTEMNSSVFAPPQN